MARGQTFQENSDKMAEDAVSTKVKTHFTNFSLEKCIDKPTHAWLQKAQAEIMANATAIPSSLGGGNHGWLGEVVAPECCVTVSDTP